MLLFILVLKYILCIKCERYVKMEKLDYVLGLDLGVASIGWAVMEIDENNEPINLMQIV